MTEETTVLKMINKIVNVRKALFSQRFLYTRNTYYVLRMLAEQINLKEFAVERLRSIQGS